MESYYMEDVDTIREREFPLLKGKRLKLTISSMEEYTDIIFRHNLP